MKNIIYLFAFLILFSCSSKKEYLDSLNTPPEIAFSTGEKNLKDSLKTSIKHGKKTYTVNVITSDKNNNLTTLSYELKSGSGKVTIDKGEKNSLDQTIYEVTFEPTTLTYNVIDFISSDGFDRTSTARLELTGFENTAPVASFTSTNVSVFDSKEFSFDASSSRDSDSRFGGGITLYKFNFNGDEKIFDKPVLKYIFPKSGSYNVSLSVQDNDGKWSEVTTKIIDVN